MFDQLAGSRSTRATPIDVTLTPGVVNSLVALGLSGGTLTVTQRDGSTVVFSRTVQLVDGVPVLDWWGYFFDPIQQLDTVSIVGELLPIGTSTIQVQLTAVSGNVSIGSLIVGVVRDLGVTLADAEISGTDYSRAEFDTALGITLLDRNAFRSRLALKVAVPAGAVDATVRLLKSLTGRPVVWLADNDGRYQSMAVLGFPTRWSKVLQYPTVSFLNRFIPARAGMPISALPTPPTRQDPANFNARADAFLAALPTFRAEANALEANVDAREANAIVQANTATAQASAALASAASASASAILAAASAGAAAWVSGTAYSIGQVVWSPITQLIYRRRVAGAGTTDPSADSANWALVAGGLPQLVEIIATSATLLAGQHAVLTNVSQTTVTLPPSPTVFDYVWVTPANGRVDTRIARNGQNIMGLAEDLDIDNANATVQLRFIGGTRGWSLV